MPFRTALSGLNAAAADLSVTGNNIANASTTGFKGSRTEFVDVYAVAFGGISKNTPGSGVRLASITQQFSQGNVEYTDNSLDLSVNGKGFFIVEDNSGVALTRAGEFHVDKDGYVVNNVNQRLQVFPPQSTTSTLFNTGVLADLQLTNSIGTPSATNLIEGAFNLDASATAKTVATLTSAYTPVFDPNNPATFDHSTSIQTYDSLGVAHSTSMYFTKVTDGTNTGWQVRTWLDGTTELTPQGFAAGTPALLTFDTSGGLQTATPVVAGTSFTLDFAPQAVAGAAALDLSLDLQNVTQFGAPFIVNDIAQDGYSTGNLSSIDIEADGVVFARFTNGEARVLGKVALANVDNPNGLRLMGNTQWAETYESGPMTPSEPLTGDIGSIQAGALESSNVDIAEQLVGLIEAQRNFQANAQVITVADAVTQTIINIR